MGARLWVNMRLPTHGVFRGEMCVVCLCNWLLANKELTAVRCCGGDIRIGRVRNGFIGK